MAEQRGISETVLLAVGSALSYAVAYAYRAGFASHFGLPPLLISPTIGSVLQAGAAVGLVLLAFWNVASGLWSWAPRSDSGVARAMRRMLAIALIAALLIFSALEYQQAWLALGAAVCFFGFFEFVFPLITQRKTVGYENKILAQEKIEANAHQFSLLGHAARTFGASAVRLASSAVLLVWLAHSLGHRAAKNQEDFYVLTDRPEHVVAAMDDNLIILAAYDPPTLALRKTFVVERLTESKGWMLRREHIGRLVAPSDAKPPAP